MLKKIALHLLLVLLVSFSAPLRASDEIFLKNSLCEAKSGDYVVILQNKNFSIFHIFQAEKNSLIVEEVSAPLKIKSEIHGKWQEWLDHGAPGHLSWVMYELNLENCQIEDIYSFTQKSWQKVYPGEQIFPTLTRLKFSAVAESRRKRVGPPLPSDMIEDRPFWQPPIFLEGKKVKGLVCKPYSTYWPNDGTELSGKKVEVFLADKFQDLPSYFPLWIQVSDKVGRVKLRVIDSGANLKSPHKKFPIPPPQLTACYFTDLGQLAFRIRSHPMFANYKLYAREIHSPTSFTLPFRIDSNPASREIQLIVSNEDLNNKLELDKLYTFTFEPEGYSYLTIETPKPIKLLKRYATK